MKTESGVEFISSRNIITILLNIFCNVMNTKMSGLNACLYFTTYIMIMTFLVPVSNTRSSVTSTCKFIVHIACACI